MSNDVLINIANELDRKGREDLADVVDEVIKSAAGRPKAPLKQLDEDVKKDLLKFLATVQKNMKDSMEALEEFFRRLRYFDIDDVIKELGLDKTLKDMEKTHDCMDSATKTMFALTHGKKPSRSDMEQMADDFGLSDSEKPNPLDFFQSQQLSEPAFDEREQEMEEEEQDEALESGLEKLHESGGPTEEDRDLNESEWLEDISSEELENFWSYEDEE